MSSIVRWAAWLCGHIKAGVVRKPRAVAVTDALSGLANPGLCMLNGSADGLPRKTVIVIGLARGGTSMVAGALEKLGVYMGETRHPVYEDEILARLIRDRNFRAAAEVVGQRTRRYDVWGFKNPARQLLSRRWQKLFGEAVYVVVFRDALAIANRRAVSLEKDLFGEISVVLNRYQEIVDFLNKSRAPVLLVSYEKALMNPANFARHLAAFLGIDDASRIAEAAGFIRPSPESYLNVARYRADWAGYLDVVEPDRVAGWAFRTGDPEPVSVRLSINDEVELVTLADLPRSDVKQRYKHVTERCGFAFHVPATLRLRAGDTVSVRIRGVEEDINNSPHDCT